MRMVCACLRGPTNLCGCICDGPIYTPCWHAVKLALDLNIFSCALAGHFNLGYDYDMQCGSHVDSCPCVVQKLLVLIYLSYNCDFFSLTSGAPCICSQCYI